jgi:hypothetical protein
MLAGMQHLANSTITPGQDLMDPVHGTNNPSRVPGQAANLARLLRAVS